MRYSVIPMFLILLSVASITACWRKPAEMQAEQKSPAAQVAEEDEEKPSAPPEQTTSVSKNPIVLMQPAIIPAEAIGGTPVTNLTEAWHRARAGMEKYCIDNQIPFEAFYQKGDMTQEGDHYTASWFGSVHDQGRYVTVLVYPDGRAEITF
jgi:hypothetical protein